MKFVFLHGEPASGKLTVAKELLGIVAGRLFENHAAIDLARTLFEFGAPGFWELVHEVRLVALRAAAQRGVPLLAATYCYSEPHDRVQFAQFEAIVQDHGGEVLPVFLHCADDELARRIGNADRVARRKITSMQGLSGFRAGFNITAVPRADCIRLDTSAAPAEATAQQIVRHFGLA